MGPMTLKSGFVHLYTGNGKGKTTAAFGIALRMLGAGGTVWIGQFLKKGIYSEHTALAAFEGKALVEQFGTAAFIDVHAPTEEDCVLARKGLNRASGVILSGQYDLVILDEAALAARIGLFTCRALVEIIKKKPNPTEIIVTGREAPPELYEAADLVTEMREIKHYYAKGIPARIGIEF
jgi:cob(I)alamin adenosyltransferase